MSRLMLIIPALIVAAMLVALARSPSLAQERRDEATSFDGQFLSISKKSNPGTSVELEKVRVRSVGGRSFLVGLGTDTQDNWQKGKTVWVALDDVAELTVFATLEDLRKAVNGQEQPKKDGGPR
jgi:hypothetical protein